jgi:putative ABC transport system permease protein
MARVRYKRIRAFCQSGTALAAAQAKFVPMLKNYLKIGIRNLLKNKLFSVINIAGMAISIATFLVITLFVADELKFDKHVEDVSLKYRVYNEYFNDDGSVKKGAMVPPVIGPTLVTDFPEVEYSTRFLNFNSNILFETADKRLTEDKGGFADATIFDMFSMQLTEGDRKTALVNPNDVAISETLAKKYFGDEPALNQIIEIFDTTYTVAAVFEDFLPQSHLQLNYLLSMQGFANDQPDRINRWGWSQFHTYIKLKSEGDAEKLEGKLPEFAQRYAWEDTKANGFYYIPHLMRMDKIHLHAYDHEWDIAVRGNIQTVYILSATALFILVIAILNFVNLSTARAMNRVKEVGVRKVMGAFRVQLIYQFISESIVVAFIAMIIGVVLTEVTLPLVNQFAEKNIPTNIFMDSLNLPLLFVAPVCVGIAAGAYPAFYISRYRPSQILNNRESGKDSGRAVLRQGLVALQFVLSFFLITASLVVGDQHTYMRTKDMGFDKDNLVVINMRGDMKRNLEATKNTFMDNPNVINATMGYGLPGQAFAGDGIKDKVTGKNMPISMLTVDHDYVKTLGLKLIAGRDFSRDFPSDERNAFIVTETAAKLLGHNDPEEALGHQVAWSRWDASDSLKEGKVIGIVKDIHLNSLQQSITPIILHIYPFAYSTITLRIKDENIPTTIAHLEASWKKFNKEYPFEYKFLDDNFDKLYKAEEKLAILFSYFTAFTIFVACLGLFGLVVYSTSQKYKEISIRKVLGATDHSLIILLGKTYMALIAIAFVIAAPFSYYAANAWLQKFAYHIEITPLLFLKAGLFIMIISLLTVGIQSFNAARRNPVDALKES